MAIAAGHGCEDSNDLALTDLNPALDLDPQLVAEWALGVQTNEKGQLSK
jgi:hypothetical protein